MNIQLLSDLHLETHPHFVPEHAPDADALILAGDIGSYQEGSMLVTQGDNDFGLARFSPRTDLAAWPVPVFFVPGNHEYDGMDFEEAHARLQESCARLQITWLHRRVIEMKGVRLIGCTLWSDFEALVPAQGPLTQQLKAREKAERAADFYLRKTGTTLDGQPFLSAAVRAQAQADQAWLTQALSEPFAGPTVVITHFAPSLKSADPRYGLTPGTAGFCNALDHLLPKANVWMHGHLHCAHDYVHEGCRVVANPLGYARKNEQLAFETRKTWRVGT
ncbi:MAG: metallophosphoesterase [Betaproteobacteria bacterium]|jgi:Calcineurin-like phosphoesterase|nr:metallophosphoesterase [Betaproteobacteria bacterium]NDD02369.1 metallophosphoesterase [Betaproteobacteria bacterium]NDE23511.1 metallophosphoesterase [Betaproteobacteria bacterium]NDF77945.1 metallophosphoesterase [Betaproteobacteria bacterium]